MKRTIVAILAISPVLLHAQAKSSAQPSSTPTLQAGITQPAALAAVHGVVAAPAPAPVVRVSTGVTPPKLVHAVDADPLQLSLINTGGGERTIVINMTVDETGKPADLKVIQSADLFTDAGVLAAVSQYRYQPATLNGTAIPMVVTLKYTIQ